MFKKTEEFGDFQLATKAKASSGEGFSLIWRRFLSDLEKVFLYKCFASTLLHTNAIEYTEINSLASMASARGSFTEPVLMLYNTNNPENGFTSQSHIAISSVRALY